MRFELLTTISILAGICCTHTVAAATSSIEQDIKTISDGPSIYFTHNASMHSLSSELIGPGDDVTSDRKTGTELLAACTALGAKANQARKAIRPLLARFPRAIHVEILPNLYYSASGDGSFEDWLMTKVMNVKNRFELTPPFMSYETIDPCSDFIKVSQEHDLQEPAYVGGRLKSALVTVRITFVYYAGACALSQITGLNLGTDRARWQEWLSGQSQPSSYSAGYGQANAYSSTVSPTTSYNPASTQRTYSPGATQSSPAAPASLQTGSYTFESLRRAAPLGQRLEVRIEGGSVLVGNLVSVSLDSVRIHVRGATIVPVSRQFITSITASAP